MSSKLPKQSGYVGLSMSRRANEAYENGEMPKSKWNKKVILNDIVNITLHFFFTKPLSCLLQ